MTARADANVVGPDEGLSFDLGFMQLRILLSVGILAIQPGGSVPGRQYSRQRRFTPSFRSLPLLHTP